MNGQAEGVEVYTPATKVHTQERVIRPELQCRLCGHVGSDYQIRETGNHKRQTCFCGKCGSYIKNLAKADKFGTKEQQLEIWKKTNGRCAYCSKMLNPFEPRGYTYDHIEAQHNGGGHQTENLVPCCKSCNSQKGKKSVDEYREYLRTKNDKPKWFFYFEVLECSSLGEYLKIMF